MQNKCNWPTRFNPTILNLIKRSYPVVSFFMACIAGHAQCSYHFPWAKQPFHFKFSFLLFNRVIAILLVICAASSTGFSQFSQKQFVTYTKSNGLTDNYITAIKQDRFGYLWIATQQGLNRFDGLNFKIFQSNHAKESLPSDDIVSLKWMDSNRLAIITKSGLNILNIQSMKQESHIIPVGALKYHYKVNSLREFLSDASGNYYVASKSGFYHFNSNNKLVFRYDDYSPEEAETAMGFGTLMAWLDDKNIIVAGQHGIYRYNTITHKFLQIKKGDNRFAVFDVINKIGKRNFTTIQPWPGCFLLFINDSDTAVFINEKQKLVKYSRLAIYPLKSEITWQSNLFVQKDSTIFLSGKKAGLFGLKINSATGAIHIDTSKLFADKRCNSFLLDKQNRPWIGSSNGLIMENRNMAGIRFGTTPEPVIKASPGAAILQVAVIEKNIFAANLSGKGMYVFNRQDLSFKKAIQFTFPSEGNNSTYAIAKKGRDTILCGANMELFWYNAVTNKTGVINMPGWDNRHHWVADMFTDKGENIWITCNQPQTVYLYKKNATLPLCLKFDQPLIKKMQEIFHIAEDKDGNIWMAGDGAARYDIRKQQFDLYLDSFPAIRWPTRQINHIVCDNQGGVWMATDANGLFLYEPATNKFSSFTKAEGLPDNQVQALKIVNNILWVACLNGIAKMDLKTRKFFPVANSKEMLNLSISSNNLCMDESRQQLYVGLGTTILQLDASAPASKTGNPRLLIENILLGNGTLQWNPSEKIKTIWDHNDITVTFNAINYYDAQDQYYAYRISNDKNKNWVLLDGQRSIVFNNLAPGRHLLEAKIFSLNNRWPPQFIKQTIIIIPPFWKRWWFTVLATFSMAGLLYAVYRYRINQYKQVIALRTKISQDLHDEVGSTLSGIAMYSHLAKGQVEKKQQHAAEKSMALIQTAATDMVDKLSDIVWAINPSQDSLKKMMNKLEDFAQGIAEVKAIKVKVAVPDKIAGHKLPLQARRNIYLLLKEAINNAVKYSEASMLELSVINYDHSLEFIVKDNGKGFDATTVKMGNGLQNMQNRATEIGAKLLMTSAPGKGSVVLLCCKIT